MKAAKESDCIVASERIGKWLATHKPQTNEQWAREGAQYCAMQALQLTVDFERLQAAHERDHGDN